MRHPERTGAEVVQRAVDPVEALRRLLRELHAAGLMRPPEQPANLRAERVPGKIHITGNTGIDALCDALEAAVERAKTRA